MRDACVNSVNTNRYMVMVLKSHEATAIVASHRVTVVYILDLPTYVVKRKTQ